MPQELTAALLPTGKLQLEWNQPSARIGKDQDLLQKELYLHWQEEYGLFLLHLGFCDPAIRLSDSLSYWRSVCALYAGQLPKTEELETLRHHVTLSFPVDQVPDLLESAPFMPGSEYLGHHCLETMWALLNTTVQAGIKAFKGSVKDYVNTLSPRSHLVGRVYFHLVESRDEDLPFAFLATYSTGVDNEGCSQHLPLKHALEKYGKESQTLLDLLVTVYQAATQSQFVTEILETGEIFHPLALSASEAYTILKECPVYEESGILCRIPNWWKHKTPGLRVNISLGNGKPSGVGLDGLLDFNAQLMLGNESMSVEEVKALLAESQGMALIKGKWIEILPEKLQQTLDAYDRARQLMLEGNLTLREAMRMQLGANQVMDMGPDTVEFSHGQWLQAVMEKLSKPSRINRVLCPKGFKAELRPYQQQGLNWLIFLNSLRLGICLADDMGLGKTVQLLAMLTSLKAKNRGKTQKTNLLVLPASLIGNWINEINRFAPSLRVFLAHPSGKAPKQALQKGPSLNKVDLVITTYALCQRYDWLNRVNWNLIILDEAQAIKNPGTKQTRAVKLFKSINRIAMTGTPIENRLSDLWSLFDFLNPGLLGTVKEFTRFTKTLRDNPAGYSRLKKVISPYILRRLKTDKSVISDLPDKVEMKTYTQLSKKQILLYQSLVQQLEQSLEAKPDGIQRKGLVLAMLSKFKQICNHPDQYTGQQAFSEIHSGKFQRLRSLCDVIVDKREQVLIFTQFKEIIAPLANTLETAFGYKGLTLHGSTAVKKRKQIVEQFQSDSYTPFMILSIKAGGVGLNLTAANHVIHFDRWWNPAVENQATDRAFRIGQHKNVVVHKFITQGTIEEKIDKMLEDKAQLSDQVIGRSSEQWITEMDNDKLMSLFTLSL